MVFGQVDVRAVLDLIAEHEAQPTMSVVAHQHNVIKTT